VERWQGSQCALQEFGIARSAAGELSLAVALDASTGQSISSLEQKLGRAFSRRFGVETELRACLWTEPSRAEPSRAEPSKV